MWKLFKQSAFINGFQLDDGELDRLVDEQDEEFQPLAFLPLAMQANVEVY